MIEKQINEYSKITGKTLLLKKKKVNLRPVLSKIFLLKYAATNKGLDLDKHKQQYAQNNDLFSEVGSSLSRSPVPVNL